MAEANINVRSTSWLQFSRLLNIDGVTCWEMPEFPDIQPADDDVIYTVARTDRIDVLAERYLGSPELWWMIAVLNDFDILPNDLYSNQTIRIMTRNRSSDIRRQAALRREGR